MHLVNVRAGLWVSPGQMAAAQDHLVTKLELLYTTLEFAFPNHTSN